MEFRNCTLDQMYTALERANKEYDSNLCFHNNGPEMKRGAYQARLATKKAGVLGSRMTHRYKNSRNASWEAHRDFLIALFDINPNANVRTRFAHYKGKARFEELYPDTAYVNIGSQMEPCAMPDLTCDPDPEPIPIPRKARKPFNTLVRTVRNAVNLRMLVGEFDDVEGVEPLESEQVLALLRSLADDCGGFTPRERLISLFAQRPQVVFGTPRGGRWSNFDQVQSQPKTRFESNIGAARRAWEAEWQRENRRYA